MATPAPTPPTAPVGLDTSGLDALIAAAAKGQAAGTGKFTWTPPPIPQRTVTAFGTQIPGTPPVTLGPNPVFGQQTVDVGGFGALISQLDPSQIEALQHQLYESGAYPASYYGKGAKPVPWGQRDPDTVQILQQMAGLASFTGNLDQILSAKVDIGALSRTQRAPLVIELPSQDDMTHVLRQSAMELLGRDPTPDELARYSSKFSDAVSAYQKQRYTAEEGGGTVTQAPSATSAAEQYLREQSPVEYGAQRIEKGLSALRQLFTGGGGGG
jgi:hypothetical protein